MLHQTTRSVEMLALTQRVQVAVVGSVIYHLWLPFSFLSLRGNAQEKFCVYNLKVKAGLLCACSCSQERCCLPMTTLLLWIKGHALSTSQFAIYSPYPLRLMTWTMEVEIMQITFPWKSPSLSRMRCELACLCSGVCFLHVGACLQK